MVKFSLGSPNLVPFQQSFLRCFLPFRGNLEATEGAADVVLALFRRKRNTLGVVAGIPRTHNGDINIFTHLF